MPLADALLVLASNMAIECTPVPLRAQERASISKAAYDARAEERASAEFDQLTISKCIWYWEWTDPEQIKGRTENTFLYGSFADTLSIDGYRERFAITCRQSIEYRNGLESSNKSSCKEEHERLMRYGDLPQEIRLQGTIGIDDAKAFLDHVFSYDYGADNESRIITMLRKVTRIEYRNSMGRLHITASYSNGCSTMFFEAPVEDQPPPRFGRVDGFQQTC